MSHWASSANARRVVQFHIDQDSGIGRVMAATVEIHARQDAIRRAREAPFLREAMLARPELVETFAADGAEAAVACALSATGDDLAIELRRRRYGLALTV